MITSVSIESFRGVREGGVEGLAPISILVGPNNTGKSTVLEALAVGMADTALGVADLVLRRGGPPLDALVRVMQRGAKHASVSLRFQFFSEAPRERKMELTVGAPNTSILPPPTEALAISLPQLGGYQSVVSVDSTGQRTGLLDLGELYPGAKVSMPVAFVDVEAVRKRGALEDAYTLASAALNASKGVVLLEEPESFQHPRYLEELARLLHLAAKDGTQVILSTHSIELIDLLLEAAEGEGQTYPAVHRLRLVDGVLRATTIDREGARIARSDLLEDLRA